MVAAVVAVVAAAVAGCGRSYDDADTTTNTVAARSEARVLELCATDDASTCTPSLVRAHTDLAYCANVRELVVHGAPVPEASVTCRPK
jgi:hypothetical protein